jgi:adenylate kinase
MSKVEELKERERKMLENKSQVLRAYLLQKVIPMLSQGILDVCKNLPEDPVEYLANYLEQNMAQNNTNK